jgi:hypothetical protein
MQYNERRIRELIIAAFNDEELMIFCYDNFREVCDRFGSDTGKTKKAWLLVEYCRRKSQLEVLIEKIKQENPAMYEKHRAQLSEPNATYTPRMDEVRAGTAAMADLFKTAATAGTTVNTSPAEPLSTAAPEHPLAKTPGEIKDRFLDLRRDLDRGEVCAFVGAGLSVGAGLPNWYTLVSELAARIGYELPPAKWATGETLIEAAQAYINQHSLFDLVRHLKDRLDTTGTLPSAAHASLARLPITTVFTANYDDLLERGYRDAGKRVHVVVQDGDIPFMRRDPSSVNIVKLYGDLNRPDSIVLARQQYEPFFLQRPQMVKLLETAVGQSTMLYLGWSHTDPHFNLVFGEMLARFGNLIRPGHAVMFDVKDNQRRELERKHIRAVELPTGDRTAELSRWLANLVP